ncbi:MAG TPA: CAP domain-containing protein [Candidatus Limnocylindria bacterium]|nr:CAP domain-containing protein [Candidatus Limnocylindria bacterium]
MSTLPSAARRPARVLAALALAAATLAAASVAPAATLAVGGSEFVRLTNQYRASDDLAPVAFNAAVDRIAVERANQMASRKSMYHDLDYISTRLRQLGVCYSNLGEIIAWESGYPSHSYERTMAQWWKSPGHHAIIVGDFNAAGGSWSVGGDGRTYSAMIFIKACATTTTVAKVATRITFLAGTHTGYRFRDGVVSQTKRATLASNSGADFSERRIIGGRAYFYIRNGIWAGYWVPETSRSYIPGFVDVHTFPARDIVFGAGTHTGYVYRTDGSIVSRKSATLYRTSGADTTKRAVINGRRCFYVVNGIWAGHWVPDTASVWLGS